MTARSSPSPTDESATSRGCSSGVAAPSMSPSPVSSTSRRLRPSRSGSRSRSTGTPRRPTSRTSRSRPCAGRFARAPGACPRAGLLASVLPGSPRLARHRRDPLRRRRRAVRRIRRDARGALGVPVRPGDPLAHVRVDKHVEPPRRPRFAGDRDRPRGRAADARDQSAAAEHEPVAPEPPSPWAAPRCRRADPRRAASSISAIRTSTRPVDKRGELKSSALGSQRYPPSTRPWPPRPACWPIAVSAKRPWMTRSRSG